MGDVESCANCGRTFYYMSFERASWEALYCSKECANAKGVNTMDIYRLVYDQKINSEWVHNLNFECWAEDFDHAKDQLLDAEENNALNIRLVPTVKTVPVVNGDS